ncbi:capsular biosynthesis protein [Rhizobiales bacterium]|uniref:capsular polysaccharide export protein, LipB/KpsS family n=1 Tax=Hongsoonwoonella zoysiae TaxID=2821844 RepID=UPI0015609D2D|nr:capsular biosynthesis protein [Hongsoonwoonella zoysiae]
MAEEKTVLFLQGPPGTFFRRVADEVEKLGHRALRINLGPADWFVWHDKRARLYRGSLRDWPAYLERFVEDHGVTDIVFYQDRLPYHAAAVELAHRRGINAVACEFGYLRPDWITLELDGMSVLSRFPDDPDAILAAAENLPEIDRRPLFKHSFFIEAFNEVLFNLLNVFFWYISPRFSQDKYYHPIAEYLSMIPRLFLSRYRDRSATFLIDDVIDAGTPYFVLPLQLQSDYQLRYNAPFEHLLDVAEKVMASFAANAQSEARLVIKVHPLDQGIEPWKREIKAMARRHGLKKRVYLIDGGNLDTLLRNAAGMLTVNSTTALHAVRVGCPIKVLGIAVYDIPRLTVQGDLDDFWRSPQKPDPKLGIAVEKLMAAGIQVKGSFYEKNGREIAAAEIARRIVEERINLPEALRGPPPRVERARRLGLPVGFLEMLAKPQRTNRWRHAARR